MNEGINETWEQVQAVGPVEQGMDVDETTPGREVAEKLHARNLAHLDGYVRARRLHVAAHPNCSEAPMCNGGVVTATINAREKISGFYWGSLLTSAIAELDALYAALKESTDACRAAEARLQHEKALAQERLGRTMAEARDLRDLAEAARVYVPTPTPPPGGQAE